ncbi:MAG: hypothetical protein NC127_05555 [Muribaculum sp.]|nr:hypothetical protein [Muribaculum sp.]
MQNPIPLIKGVIILLVGVITAVSCTRHREAESRLDHIEADILPHNPDSALVMLESMDTTALNSKRARALHTLLLAAARHKCYAQFPSDTELRLAKAARYFRHHDDPRHTMMAQFYRAVSFYDAGDFSHAVFSAMESEDLAALIDDNYYLGRIYDLLADINYETYNFTESQDARNKASTYFLKADSLAQYYFALTELAVGYNSNNMPDSCIILLDSISRRPQLEHYSSSNLNAYILSCYIAPLTQLKSYSSLDSIIDRMHEYPEFEYTLNNYSDIIISYIDRNKIDKAKTIILWCLGNFGNETKTSIAFQTAMYDYCLSQDDYEDALRCLQNIYEISNERVGIALDQTVAIAQRDHETSVKRRHKAQVLKLRTILIVLAIFVIIIATIGVMFYRERIKRKNIEISTYLRDIQQMQHIATNGDEKVQKLQSLINDMLGGQYEILNRLCDEYFDARDTSRIRNTLYNKIQDEIKNICNPNTLKSIEQMVDDCMDGIVRKLREQLPSLKPVDITISTLVFAGLSPRAICIVIDAELSYYYNKRKRIKDRILQSDAEDKDLFLTKFNRRYH